MVVQGGSDARLRPAEQQRIELQKALEDERKRRDQDAELIRKEMEKLRTELLAVRTALAAPSPNPQPATLTRD